MLEARNKNASWRSNQLEKQAAYASTVALWHLHDSKWLISKSFQKVRYGRCTLRPTQIRCMYRICNWCRSSMQLEKTGYLRNQASHIFRGTKAPLAAKVPEQEPRHSMDHPVTAIEKESLWTIFWARCSPGSLATWLAECRTRVRRDRTNEWFLFWQRLQRNMNETLRSETKDRNYLGPPYSRSKVPIHLL